MIDVCFKWSLQCSASDSKCRKVFLAALASLLLAVSTGLVVGFPSTALVDMDRVDSSIRPSPEMKTWIASITDIGEIIGCLIAAPLSERFGRCQGLIITVFPFLIGWIFIIAANNVALLICGRVFTGLCSGLSMAIVPTYLIEIATPEIRGFLGASFQALFAFGILLSNVIGWFLSWKNLAIVSATLPASAFFVLCFMPESPRWLVAKGHREDALRALSFLHGVKMDPVDQVSVIEEDLRKQGAREKLRLSEIRNPIFWKPLALSLMLMFYKEVSGICIFLYYSVEIFNSAGTTINSHLSAIIVSIIQILSTLISALIVDKTGRRILLSISSVGMSVSLISLGAYFFVKENNVNVESSAFNYLPLVSIVGYIATYSIGYGPVPWMMMNELSPLKIRSLTSSLASSFNSGLAFVATKTFIDLQYAINKSGSYWLYGGVSLTSIVLVWCCLPETKGKPLEDISDYFTKKSKKSETNNVFTVTHM